MSQSQSVPLSVEEIIKFDQEYRQKAEAHELTKNRP